MRFPFSTVFTSVLSLVSLTFIHTYIPNPAAATVHFEYLIPFASTTNTLLILFSHHTPFNKFKALFAKMRFSLFIASAFAAAAVAQNCGPTYGNQKCAAGKCCMKAPFFPMPPQHAKQFSDKYSHRQSIRLGTTPEHSPQTATNIHN